MFLYIEGNNDFSGERNTDFQKKKFVQNSRLKAL